MVLGLSDHRPPARVRSVLQRQNRPVGNLVSASPAPDASWKRTAGEITLVNAPTRRGADRDDLASPMALAPTSECADLDGLGEGRSR